MGAAAMNSLERNKQRVVAFYDLMFNQCRPREAIERYAGDEYIQHNPGVADGREGFINYFEEAAREYPGTRVVFKRVIAEGNYVVLHCRQEWPGDHVWTGLQRACGERFRLIRACEPWSSADFALQRRRNRQVP